MIHVGKPAPDFTLEGVFKGEVKKYSLGGKAAKWLVLFFYPKDFTYICPTEIKAFSQHAHDFGDIGAEVLGISVDSVESHKKWVESGELGDVNFPLLSDEGKTMTNDYGVMKEDEQLALRGTFIIDPDGVVRYMLVSDNDVGRSVTETLRVIKALQMGKLCPVEWEPGKPTVGPST
ncbi:MAG TPA: peroxiredoxin [Candidatus Paceibacterota bacterium]